MYENQEGNDLEAVEYAEDLLHFAMGIEQYPGSIWSHLVALATYGLAADAIEIAAPSLRIGDAARARKEADCIAAPEQVRFLIETLLDNKPLVAGAQLALYGERAGHLDIIQSLCDGKPTRIAPGITVNPISRGLAKVAWRMDAATGLELVTAASEAVLARNYPRAKRTLLPSPNVSGHFDLLLKPCTSILTGGYGRIIQIGFQYTAERRMAAIALAIRWYEIDNGKRPDALADLVPRYLDSVPLDPFAEDDTELGYRPDTDPPILYSVSLDGIDDDGAFELDYRRSRVDWDAMDLPFFLNGDRPIPEHD